MSWEGKEGKAARGSWHDPGDRRSGSALALLGSYVWDGSLVQTVSFYLILENACSSCSSLLCLLALIPAKKL